MPRVRSAVVVAPLVAAGMAGALALAPGSAAPTLGQRAMPASGPPGVLPDVVLEGSAPRPATAFALRTTAGGTPVAGAEVEWTPQGADRCPAAAVPLGGSGTEVDVDVDGEGAFGGRVRGRLYAPQPDCGRAVGIWRGVDGTYAGRDGGLVLTLEPGGAVRLVLSP